MTIRLLSYLAALLILSCGFACGSDDDDAVPTPRVTVADYLGTYTATEDCEGNTDTYTVTITQASGGDVFIDNLFDFGDRVRAEVDGSALTIPEQTDNGRDYSGSGSRTEEALTINFRIGSIFFNLSCRARLVLQ